MTLLNELWKEVNESKFLRSARHSQHYEKINSIYANYRNALRRARPFIIDDKALEVAYDLSLQDPSRVAARLPLARLPYDVVWLEFDFRHKTSYAAKMGHAQVPTIETPERLGWLLERDPLNENRWSAVCFTTVPPDIYGNVPDDAPNVSIYTITMLFDIANEGPPNRIADKEGFRFHEMIDTKVAGDDWKEFRHILWGWQAAGPIGKEEDGTRYMRVGMPPESIRNAVNFGVEALASISLLEATDYDRFRSIRAAGHEARGDARLVTTLLSLINEVPIERVEAKPKGTFRAGGNLTKYLSYSTVSIMIPAKRPLRVVDRILKNAEKTYKKRHEVRGHWRTIIHKKDHVRKKLLPDGTYQEITFLKGELERGWVKEHERGDASLGWVEHSYLVEKAKR